jgi:hypothetical protein
VKFHLNTRRYDEEALASTELEASGQVGGVQKRIAWAPCPGNNAVLLWMTLKSRYVVFFLWTDAQDSAMFYLCLKRIILRQREAACRYGQSAPKGDGWRPGKASR